VGRAQLLSSYSRLPKNVLRDSHHHRHSTPDLASTCMLKTSPILMTRLMKRIFPLKLLHLTCTPIPRKNTFIPSANSLPLVNSLPLAHVNNLLLARSPHPAHSLPLDNSHLLDRSHPALVPTARINLDLDAVRLQTMSGSFLKRISRRRRGIVYFASKFGIKIYFSSFYVY
jgi:hypothetical protein